MHSSCSLGIILLPEDLNFEKFRSQSIQSRKYYLQNRSNIYCHITHHRQKLYSSRRLFRELQEEKEEEEKEEEEEEERKKERKEE